MIMMGSLQPLELRKMAVEGLLYLQALPAWRYGSILIRTLLLFVPVDAVLFINPSLLYLLSFEQVLESSGTLGKGQKRKASQLNKAITIGSSPILYTQPVASAGKKILRYYYTTLAISHILMQTSTQTRLDPNLCVKPTACLCFRSQFRSPPSVMAIWICWLVPQTLRNLGLPSCAVFIKGSRHPSVIYQATLRQPLRLGVC